MTLKKSPQYVALRGEWSIDLTICSKYDYLVTPEANREILVLPPNTRKDLGFVAMALGTNRGRQNSRASVSPQSSGPADVLKS